MSRRCSSRGSWVGTHSTLSSPPASSVMRNMPIARHADQAARERRLLEDDQRVERVAVLAEGVLDEAVVGGVRRRGEQHPVQPDPAGLVVDLVLVALTLGDLDQHVELEHGFLRNVAALGPVRAGAPVVPHNGLKRAAERGEQWARRDRRHGRRDRATWLPVLLVLRPPRRGGRGLPVRRLRPVGTRRAPTRSASPLRSPPPEGWTSPRSPSPSRSPTRPSPAPLPRAAGTSPRWPPAWRTATSGRRCTPRWRRWTAGARRTPPTAARSRPPRPSSSPRPRLRSTSSAPTIGSRPRSSHVAGR